MIQEYLSLLRFESSRVFSLVLPLRSLRRELLEELLRCEAAWVLLLRQQHREQQLDIHMAEPGQRGSGS